MEKEPQMSKPQAPSTSHSDTEQEKHQKVKKRRKLAKTVQLLLSRPPGTLKLITGRDGAFIMAEFYEDSNLSVPAFQYDLQELGVECPCHPLNKALTLNDNQKKSFTKHYVELKFQKVSAAISDSFEAFKFINGKWCLQSDPEDGRELDNETNEERLSDEINDSFDYSPLENHVDFNLRVLICCGLGSHMRNGEGTVLMTGLFCHVAEAFGIKSHLSVENNGGGAANKIPVDVHVMSSVRNVNPDVVVKTITDQAGIYLLIGKIKSGYKLTIADTDQLYEMCVASLSRQRRVHGLLLCAACAKLILYCRNDNKIYSFIVKEYRFDDTVDQFKFMAFDLGILMQKNLLTCQSVFDPRHSFKKFKRNP